VDDVETNIYVARGLMSPYKLHIDSSASGFAAIDKIKGGKIYDIIFMDHMMPKMDGVEATKIIRGLGYKHPVVALTANAVIGQADMFYENGFDDFISKPIDVRQLNSEFNKLKRDKQPAEVIEAARRQADTKDGQLPDHTQEQAANSNFNRLFIQDARNALAALEKMMKIDGSFGDEDDVMTYIINAHGLKSLLALAGNTQLSCIAAKLEQAGKDRDAELITLETPAFLSSLRAYIAEYASPEKNSGETVDEDLTYLRDMLLAVKMACYEYDNVTATNTLKEMMGKTWSGATKEILDTLSTHTLYGDCDEAVEILEDFLESIDLE
jgi:CheY-like chemotaxis protein